MKDILGNHEREDIPLKAQQLSMEDLRKGKRKSFRDISRERKEKLVSSRICRWMMREETRSSDEISEQPLIMNN
ncbi:MAG: hypothetical protein DRJ59_00305 [Thermoprotei archaeon]|nr:MAG: hypothetical protein DRJ59_00305 [Thermoprotei archaeon]